MEASESFDILAQEDSDVDIQDEWTPDFRKNQERKRLIKRILKLCGKDDGTKKPLHVAIIGYAGVGKSAFVNTLAAALGGDRWREYAYAGSHGPVGGGITFFTNSFPKCCKQEQYKDYLLPTLIDIMGFDDNCGDEFIELLRIVFYGRLPEGESLSEAAQYYKDKGLDGLRTKYSQNNEKLKVDRVIFLSSATQLVPENLISCVIQAARPPGTKGNPKRRTIPLFGVMLKYDKVVSNEEYAKREASGDVVGVVSEEEYEKRELKFIHGLGLGGSKHRFLRCSNYCDDIDKDNKRVDTVIPDLDLPVLQLFTQVADPVIKVHNEDETYMEEREPEIDTKPDRKSHERTPPKQNLQGTLVENFGENVLSVMLISFEALLVAFVLKVLLKPPIDMAKLKGICNVPDSKCTQMAGICNDVANLSTQTTFILALVALIGIRVLATLATVGIFKRK